MTNQPEQHYSAGADELADDPDKADAPLSKPFILIQFDGPGMAQCSIEATCIEAQVFGAAWLLNQWAQELRIAQVAAMMQAEQARSRGIIVPNRQGRRHPTDA